MVAAHGMCLLPSFVERVIVFSSRVEWAVYEGPTEPTPTFANEGGSRSGRDD